MTMPVKDASLLEERTAAVMGERLQRPDCQKGP